MSLSSSFSARSSSSSESSPSFSSSSSSWRAARRRLRTATLPSSAMCLTTFTSSLRRSSVSGGKVRRIEMPSLLGLRPEVGLLDAPSRWRRSPPCRRGVMTSMAGLGHLEAGELLERDLGAVVVDRDLLDQGRGGPTGADRRRTRPGRGATAFSIFSSASSSTSRPSRRHRAPSGRSSVAASSGSTGAPAHAGAHRWPTAHRAAVARGLTRLSGRAYRSTALEERPDVARRRGGRTSRSAGRCPCRA